MQNLGVSDTWTRAVAGPLLKPGEAHVWRFKLEPESETELKELRGLLNEDEIRRADRFYFPRDQRRYAVGRANLRRILSLYLKKPARSLEFEYGPQRKPSLVPESQPAPDRLEFNLSHSHETALLALTLNRQVGVDLEFAKEGRDILKLTGQVFTGPELAEFVKIPPDRQKEAFYNAWTRKEAYMKACGGGLSIGLDQIEVSFHPAEPARILRINREARLAAGWSLLELHPGPDYKAALVLEGAPPILTVWDL